MTFAPVSAIDCSRFSTLNNNLIPLGKTSETIEKYQSNRLQLDSPSGNAVDEQPPLVGKLLVLYLTLRPDH